MSSKNDSTRTAATEMMEGVGAFVNNYHEEFMELTEQINSLQLKKAELVKKMDEFIDNLASVSGLPKERLQKKYLGKHFSLIGKSIGDALELILITEGAQRQKDLIHKMRAEGVKISEKAPYAVIKNAIMRDKRKRFKMLDDGRVDLQTKTRSKRSWSGLGKKLEKNTRGIGA